MSNLAKQGGHACLAVTDVIPTERLRGGDSQRACGPRGTWHHAL